MTTVAFFALIGQFSLKISILSGNSGTTRHTKVERHDLAPAALCRKRMTELFSGASTSLEPYLSPGNVFRCLEKHCQQFFFFCLGFWFWIMMMMTMMMICLGLIQLFVSWDWEWRWCTEEDNNIHSYYISYTELILVSVFSYSFHFFPSTLWDSLADTLTNSAVTV